jgi:glycosyltransferase involved in cell wall biosynthesis
MVKAKFPEKTNFIPHAVPKEMYYTLKEDVARNYKRQLIGENRVDHFTCIWANRNAKRKRPNDVLLSWKLFLELLEKKHGHRNATLLMHTDPHDMEGSNLIVVNELLKTTENVVFSKDRVTFEQMNVLYNISDVCLTISLNEGFGLGTLEAMMTGKPIIAVKTGGLTRQVVDHRDGTENGIALPVELSTLVGSQLVPYIYERMVSCETTAAALLRMYEMGPDERKKLGKKAQAYVHSEFDLANTIKMWDDTMTEVIDKWKNDSQSIYQPWICKTL